MSDTQPQPEPEGSFGDLQIRDDLIDVIRHPDNRHLDEKKEQELPDPA